MSAPRQDGYIKFDCRWTQAEAPAAEILSDINIWRSRLFELGMVGVMPDGIGFGNLSVRFGVGPQFIITGTQTGAKKMLTPEDYTVVSDFNLEQNWLECRGPIKASSESLTHGVLYQISKTVNAVIHVHHHQLWQALLPHVPVTSKNAQFGTPELAREVGRLFHKKDLEQFRIFAMGGHPDGVVAFGKTMAEAGETLLQYMDDFLAA